MLYIINYFSDRSFGAYIQKCLHNHNDIRFISFETRGYTGFRRKIYRNALFLRQIFNFRGLFSGILFSKKFRNAIKEITPDDRVLLFSMHSIKHSILLSKEIPCKSMDLFLWDPASWLIHSEKRRKKYIDRLGRTGIRVSTFDKKDAAAYGWRLVNQIYCRTEYLPLPPADTAQESKPEQLSVFFTAYDKNRREILSDIVRVLDDNGIRPDFHILADKKNNPRIPPILTPFYFEKELSYPEYLARAVRASAMLEILQPGQSGMTMRMLESLFLGKKLITNNPDARNFDFYHPDNIYVIDGKETRGIREFLSTPLRPVGDDIKMSYDIEHWISRFL